MVTQFICLANSKKYNERCMAGVLVDKKEKGYALKKKANRPAWIRPVTQQAHGQVPSELVAHVKLLDVVSIDIEANVPNGYQSENVLFKPDSLAVVDHITASKANLDLLLDSDSSNIFGNWGKAVHKDKIDEVTYSLTMVKAREPEVYLRTEYNKEQYRLKFDFNETKYDLPITDVTFLEYIDSLKTTNLTDILRNDIFLTISLGLEHNQYHSKLIAGIIMEKVKPDKKNLL